MEKGELFVVPFGNSRVSGRREVSRAEPWWDDCFTRLMGG